MIQHISITLLSLLCFKAEFVFTTNSPYPLYTFAYWYCHALGVWWLRLGKVGFRRSKRWENVLEYWTFKSCMVQEWGWWFIVLKVMKFEVDKVDNFVQGSLFTCKILSTDFPKCKMARWFHNTYLLLLILLMVGWLFFIQHKIHDSLPKCGFNNNNLTFVFPLPPYFGFPGKEIQVCELEPTAHSRLWSEQLPDQDRWVNCGAYFTLDTDRERLRPVQQQVRRNVSSGRKGLMER